MSFGWGGGGRHGVALAGTSLGGTEVSVVLLNPEPALYEESGPTPAFPRGKGESFDGWTYKQFGASGVEHSVWGDGCKFRGKREERRC